MRGWALARSGVCSGDACWFVSKFEKKIFGEERRSGRMVMGMDIEGLSRHGHRNLRM